jgi:hypothetical protein
MERRHLILIALSLIACAVVIRLVPHLPNATPLTALAFAGGLYLGRMWALALPLGALILSDLALGMYDWKLMASVYGSFALIGLLTWLVRKKKQILPVGLSIVGSSLLFFFITNTAVWAFSPWYEKSIAGLLLSLELGIPFLRNMLVGDLFYCGLVIGAFEAVRQREAVKAFIRAHLAGLRRPARATIAVVTRATPEQ